MSYCIGWLCVRQILLYTADFPFICQYLAKATLIHSNNNGKVRKEMTKKENVEYWMKMSFKVDAFNRKGSDVGTGITIDSLRLPMYSCLRIFLHCDIYSLLSRIILQSPLSITVCFCLDVYLSSFLFKI